MDGSIRGLVAGMSREALESLYCLSMHRSLLSPHISFISFPLSYPFCSLLHLSCHLPFLSSSLPLSPGSLSRAAGAKSPSCSRRRTTHRVVAWHEARGGRWKEEEAKEGRKEGGKRRLSEDSQEKGEEKEKEEGEKVKMNKVWERRGGKTAYTESVNLKHVQSHTDLTIYLLNLLIIFSVKRELFINPAVPTG